MTQLRGYQNQKDNPPAAQTCVIVLIIDNYNYTCLDAMIMLLNIRSCARVDIKISYSIETIEFTCGHNTLEWMVSYCNMTILSSSAAFFINIFNRVSRGNNS